MIDEFHAGCLRSKVGPVATERRERHAPAVGGRRY
jgi:hypothetical protein